MANAGRAFDAEIAEVVLQAIYDGAVTYDRVVEVVRAQAAARAKEVAAEGATRAEREAERRRWASFGKSSITRWKRIDPAFERNLIEAQDEAAREEIVEVLALGELAVAVATNDGQHAKGQHSPEERRLWLAGLKHQLNAKMWSIDRRLAVRRTYHGENVAPALAPALPEMPYNPRFDELPSPGGSRVN